MVSSAIPSCHSLSLSLSSQFLASHCTEQSLRKWEHLSVYLYRLKTAGLIAITIFFRFVEQKRCVCKCVYACVFCQKLYAQHNWFLLWFSAIILHIIHLHSGCHSIFCGMLYNAIILMCCRDFWDFEYSRIFQWRNKWEKKIRLS